LWRQGEIDHVDEVVFVKRCVEHGATLKLDESTLWNELLKLIGSEPDIHRGLACSYRPDVAGQVRGLVGDDDCLTRRK